MALDKKNLALPFSTGVDTFTDSLQVMPTNLLSLENAVFTKDKLLTKRNGYRLISSLPANSEVTTLTTFKQNLTAVGNRIYAYNAIDNEWLDHGRYQPVQLSVMPVTRNSGSQTKQDAAVAGGLVCTAFFDSVQNNSMYQINSSDTGQLVAGPTALPAGSMDPRVLSFINYFIVVYLVDIIGTTHLQFIAIPKVNVNNPLPAVDISTTVSSISAGYDCMVLDNYFYVCWDGSDVGGALRATFYDTGLNQQITYISPGSTVNLASIVGDMNNVYITFYTGSTTSTYVAVLTPLLSETLPPTLVDAVTPVFALTSSVASADSVQVYTQVGYTYPYVSKRSDYVQKYTVDTTGAAGPQTVVVRSVGLASKSFIIGDTQYFLATYDGTYQPTYFLIDENGNVIAKVAYSNGAGYAISQVLPSATVEDFIVKIPYLFKTTLTPVNKAQGVPSVAGIYSQLGVNLASLDLSAMSLATAEIGNNLHIAGGFLWMYDGAASSEHNFHVWPDDVVLAAANTMGGTVGAGDYFYQVTYEWTDAQGNIHRSAPSIPMAVTVGGGDNSVVVDVPTLRLTYKSEVRIVIYRWSTAQQNYYQVTSITNPLLNDTSVNYVAFTDLLADSAIIGNQLIYTTGGVVENIAMPAVGSLGLFKNRLVAIDSEDPDLLWYSKQVIEGVPVEPSDLFTIFVAPTISSQGSTGSTKVLSAMDDKLICFKKDAIYYITGTGPDNLGTNNDFSEPVFITSTVGCDNIHGVVFSPAGILFKSDKGIWKLGRDLSTDYSGALVQAFNDFDTTSALGIPNTNQVRFTLDSDRALMYDYFFDRWGTFNNLPAISSCLYQDMHTYLDKYGRVLQEEIGYYQDGTRPTLMSFETAWFNLLGLQGFERAYMLYILGTFLSPHKLQVDVSFDYELSPSQSVLINPSNYYGTYAVVPPFYAQGTYAGPGSLEQWRVFLKRQKLQAFKIKVTEIFDATQGTQPGAGLTFSGLNLVIGAKKGYTPLPSSNSVG